VRERRGRRGREEGEEGEDGGERQTNRQTMLCRLINRQFFFKEKDKKTKMCK
jgi:hypothetical protein